MLLNMTTTTHPYYDGRIQDWTKWRYTYEGGRRFIDQYLEQFSSREDTNDFKLRKSVTYCPAFAKAAIDDVKNSIYQRMCDIVRVGGSPTYVKTVAGQLGGVDLKGSTMNSFIGCEVLPELLTMEKVGIFIDAPVLHAPDLHSNLNKHPYLYVYRTEQIKCWAQSADGSFESVLLEDSNYDIDPETGFPQVSQAAYRFLQKRDGVVYVTLYNDNNEVIGEPARVINIPEIPFVCVEISSSLLTDIADYQIALLNLASADMGFALKSNFPFYTEQYNPNQELLKLSMKNAPGASSDDPGPEDVNVGIVTGRRYPINTNMPAFIHPSTEPMTASMLKQDQLKKEIRQILNLNISNISVPRASAESKRMDSEGLESGLSYIGLALEIAENKIAKIWSAYENSELPEVKYPQKYELRSDADRRNEAKDLTELIEVVPSRTYQKQVAKQVANVMLGGKVSLDTLVAVHKEIDSADVVSAKPKDLIADVENGLASKDTVSQIRGYRPGEATKAEEEHKARLEAIALSQAKGAGAGSLAARGISDGSATPKQDAAAEKKVPQDTQATVTDNTRGEGK